MYLKSQKEADNGVLAPEGGNIVGNCLIHESAQIDENAVVGPNVVVGAGCRIGAFAKV